MKNNYYEIVSLIENNYKEYLDRPISINNIDLYTIIQNINPKYRLYVFSKISNLLNSDDYCSGLKYAYTKTKDINTNDSALSLDEILDLFRKADKKKLMGIDYRRWKKFQDIIVIYRGTSKTENKNAISWTIDRNIAIWFYKKYNSVGTVYKAKIKKDDIICFFDKDACNEKEVIINYKNILSLEELSKNELKRDVKINISSNMGINTDYVIAATSNMIQKLADMGVLPTQELGIEIFNFYQTSGQYKSKYIVQFPDGTQVSLNKIFSSILESQDITKK